MADKVIRVKECDIPNCPTPDDNVVRVTSTLQGAGTVVMDLCALHQTPILELRKHAHKKVAARRRRGIQVTEPKKARSQK